MPFQEPPAVVAFDERADLLSGLLEALEVVEVQALLLQRPHESLRGVAQVGGWKTTQVLSDVYQTADRDAMEAVAVGARPVRRRPH